MQWNIAAEWLDILTGESMFIGSPIFIISKLKITESHSMSTMRCRERTEMAWPIRVLYEQHSLLFASYKSVFMWRSKAEHEFFFFISRKFLAQYSAVCLNVIQSSICYVPLDGRFSHIFFCDCESTATDVIYSMLLQLSSVQNFSLSYTHSQ